MAERVKVGVVGVGKIFPAYVAGCRNFPLLELVALADIDGERASQQAAEHGVPRVLSVDALLADPEIQIVVNLTVPKVHAAVSLAAIAAGKHVYTEKPLAVTRVDGQRIVQAAAERGVRVGSAPDTFLGGGQQTCRKLIDDGWIGEPVAAVAFMMGHGPESWHPNPDFFYQAGGGPLLDMGPYYLTSLINLLGPVRRVAGSARASFPERVATSRQHFGRRLPVEVPTHVAALLDFAAGPVATLITSFDVWHASLPRIEVYGSEGTLSVPDPSIFGGMVRVRRAGAAEWSEMPLLFDDQVGRGIGVADLAYAIHSGRPHRANGELAYHVLDIMQAVEESSDGGQHVTLESSTARPAPLPMGLLRGEMDA
ncbi:MAG TPA: Gfo/Idh/MocA family oxidoreductase [Anaerolineae bacterium]|nr:Gfo/Idh/MocA family oxidoreductase [Anaerolineae bacterium]HNU04090.1 Gfo/Idh/MocA family oxidoreductase [Anaerolineae bacterium]